jgi:hypothetical protein
MGGGGHSHKHNEITRHRYVPIQNTCTCTQTYLHDLLDRVFVSTGAVAEHELLFVLLDARQVVRRGLGEHVLVKVVLEEAWAAQQHRLYHVEVHELVDGLDHGVEELVQRLVVLRGRHPLFWDRHLDLGARVGDVLGHDTHVA